MQKKKDATERALRSLAYRAHSEKEIIEKLEKSGFDERDIAEAMQKLTDYALVDDQDFARQWALSRARRGVGPRRITQELRQKGIDSELIHSAVSEIDEDASFASAINLAAKYMRQDNPNARQRALNALMRRGYDYGIAKEAVNTAVLEAEENADA